MLSIETLIKQNEQMYCLYGILTNTLASLFIYLLWSVLPRISASSTYMIHSGFNYLQNLKIHVKRTANSADSGKSIPLTDVYFLHIVEFKSLTIKRTKNITKHNQLLINL